MFLHVEEANYITDYQLKLKFNNDEIRTVDLKINNFSKIFLYLIILLNGKMGQILH